MNRNTSATSVKLHKRREWILARTIVFHLRGFRKS